MYVCLLVSSKTTLQTSILKLAQRFVFLFFFFLVPVVHDLGFRITSNEIIMYFLKISSA